MRPTTIQKYNKLCDMNIINKQDYDINRRIDIIISEIQQQLAIWEQEARAIYWPETAKKENK